jgi:hypothetical protein
MTETPKMNTDVETVLPERLTEAAELAPDQLGASLADIRRRGTGRRRARTGLTVAAALVGVGGLTVTALAVVPGKGSAPEQFGAPPVAVASPSYEPDTPIGPTWKTGISYGDGELTVWVEKPAVYNGKIMVAIAIRHPDGSLQRCGEAIDLAGDDLAPGIHEGYNVLDGTPDRAFTLVGYVVGTEVAALTMTIDGTRHTAKLVTWPADPRVKIWWLAGPDGATPDTNVEPTNVVGTDKAGAKVLSAAKYPIAVG